MATDSIKQAYYHFQSVADAVLNDLTDSEHLTLELSGESSQFTRFNNAKIRQSGLVEDAYLGLSYIHNNRKASVTVPFSGNLAQSLESARLALARLRRETPQLPEDPFIVYPENKGSSEAFHEGVILAENAVADALFPPVVGIDFTGIYAAGDMYRANKNSAGQSHWFSTKNFIVDYSMITPNEKMVKGTFAGRDWDQAAYEANIERSKQQFEFLGRPSKTVPRGKYRSYLAPAAVADLVNMLSWDGVSEASLQQGHSALLKMRKETIAWSPLLTIRENFSSGIVPRFNELGETAPELLPLIEKGKLANTLISSRTAKEYHLTANGASGAEGMRSPEVLPGTLKMADILKELNTGMYLSNLHYLNWSDNAGGRITGMTRYACFWVENGEIIAPIENMRWDETIYHIFGDKLMNLTDRSELIPSVSTYDQRDLGGAVVPGILVDDFSFTL